MKLQQKTIRVNFLISLVILAVAGLVLFFTLQSVFTSELDEQLESVMQTDFNAIANGGQLTDRADITIKKLPDIQADGKIFSDTSIYNPIEKEYEPFRLLTAVKTINGESYEFKSFLSQLEWDDFFQVIVYIFIGIAFLLVLVNWLLNNYFLGKIWQPFFSNLNVLRDYSISSGKEVQLTPSDIDEFEVFRTTTEHLLERVKNEYAAVKEFSENAAHELQTPLSVIRHKLDHLLQSQNLDEDCRKKLYEATKAADRIISLNRSLLLLTRLNNQEFDLSEKIEPTVILRSVIGQMEDLFEIRDLSLDIRVSQNPKLLGNYSLCEMLFRNLLQNMIRHTPENGSCEITVEQDSISFANTGAALPFDEELLFNRFQKGAGNGTGLGLAIAAEICKLLHWQLTYEYADGKHFFTVAFNRDDS